MKKFNNPIYVTKPLLADLGDINKKLKQIWDAAWLTNNGRQHQSLEEELKKLLKVPYLSLYNNGTIALIAALKCLHLAGEVITTPFTFPATVHSLTLCGLTPVFCDIDQETMNLDANKLEELITSKTSGILGVHVFGSPCDVHKIQTIANHFNLKVIYDAAHAFNLEIDGVGIGTFGDVSMFSFHATKLFHTIEGGALTFNSKVLKEDSDLIKNFGIKNENEVVLPGFNGKMNELQAAIGLVNLEYLADERAKRQQIIDTYKSYLQDVKGIKYYNLSPNIKPSLQYFVIRINAEEFGKTRDQVYQALRDCNVFARKYFFPLCSNYPCYQKYSSASKAKLPVANKVVSEVLSLPLYGDLKISEVEQICDILIGLSKNRS